jgi:murein L,D-transpeptidase YafK
MMKKQNFILKMTYLLALFATTDLSAQVYPQALLKLDNLFTHHVIVAEKATHRIHLYENDNGLPKLISTYKMATGRKAGNKLFQGDFKTPEGVYQLIDFIPHETLLKKYGKDGEIYGVGSFVMNYPNPIDRKEGKTGGGIWLHSTNDETRIEKGLDSRGCVVMANDHLIEISKYIEIDKTLMIVVDNLYFLDKTAWNKERKKISDLVNNWLTAWKEEDITQYLSYYHSKQFSDPNRGNFKNFSQYKKAVFKNPGKPSITIGDFSILSNGRYAVVTLDQKYVSNKINDLGKKTLYLMHDNFYNWKIVSEVWSKLQVDIDHVAFTPSLRFFKSEHQEKTAEN